MTKFILEFRYLGGVLIDKSHAWHGMSRYPDETKLGYREPIGIELPNK
jgi:hypothetical protein